MRFIAVLMVFFMLGSCAYASLAIRCQERSMLLSRDGAQIIAPGIYTEITPLGSDRFAVRKGDRFAICDGNGTLLTDFLYSDVRIDTNRIIAGYHGSYGMLDMDGNQLIDAKFSKIVSGSDGVAWALGPDADQLYLIKEDTVRYAPQTEIEDIADASGCGLLAIRTADSNSWGYCDENGHTVIQCIYSAADPFADARARVVRNGFYGVIGNDGSEVVPFMYDYLDISDSLIVGIRSGSIVDVYDHDGTLIDRFTDVTNGFALFGDQYVLFENDRVRLFDAEGTCLDEYPSRVLITAGIGDGLIVSNGEWGTKSVWLHGAETELWQAIIPLGYSGGEPVYRGGIFDVAYALDMLLEQEVYAVDMSSARYMILNTEGKAVLDETWKSITYVDDDRFLVETSEEWQLIDSTGCIYYTIEKQEEEPHE